MLLDDVDEATRTRLEAAAFRRLVAHFRHRTDVQNIDLMGHTGFCRNCLGDWLKEAAETEGVDMSKAEARESVYGMPQDVWKDRHQAPASDEQIARMNASVAKNA
ncbi:MAG: DUF1244 domain-containing protein [Pseudomonadota bacterium]